MISGCLDSVRSTLVSVQVVTTVKTVYASAGIDKFLLAGIERVAFGTNFHAYILASRTGMDYLAAGARDRCVNVLGMNAFLQLMSPLFFCVVNYEIIPHAFRQCKYYFYSPAISFVEASSWLQRRSDSSSVASFAVIYSFIFGSVPDGLTITFAPFSRE